jgi:hypothetical protein
MQRRNKSPRGKYVFFDSLSLSLLRALVFDIEFRASIFFGSTLAIIARKCVCVCVRVRADFCVYSLS